VADMSRDNDLTISGYRVLRFPAFAVRDHPAVVAAKSRPRCGWPSVTSRTQSVDSGRVVPGFQSRTKMSRSSEHGVDCGGDLSARDKGVVMCGEAAAGDFV